MPPSLRTLIDAPAIAALWGRSKARAEFCRALRIARENCRNTAWRNNAANESLLGWVLVFCPQTVCGCQIDRISCRSYKSK
jgi:hypothetical protein